MDIRFVVVAVASLALGGHVSAQTNGSQPFSIQFAGAAGPAGLGAPITVLNGTIYQDPNGSDFPPDPIDFSSFPSLQWDSYIALDPVGPAAPGTASSAPDGTDGVLFGPNSLEGDWFSDFGIPSTVGPFPGLHSVFIARLAVTSGATLDAPLLGAMVDNEFGMQIFEGPLVFGTTDQPPNRGGGAAYDFRSTFTRVSFPLPSSDGEFGRGTSITLDIYDIYLVALPTPGALALFAIAGMTTARRRRPVV